MGFSNENISLSLPVVEILANDIGGVSPLPAVSLTGDFGGNLVAELPAVTLSSEVYIGSGGVLALDLPAVKLSSNMISGNQGTLDLSVPAVALEVEYYVAGYLSKEVPATTISADGGPLGVWEFTREVPAVVLSAYGLEVVDTTSTDYEVWVVNSETRMHANYTNWNANSYGRFNGVDIVSNDSGLHEITGTDDEGTNIDGKIYWAPSDFGSQMQKRIDYIVANVRGAEEFNIVLWVDETEKRIINKNVLASVEGLHRTRILVPLGIRGQVWKIGLENVNGSEFEVTELEAVTIDSKRRFK